MVRNRSALRYLPLTVVLDQDTGEVVGLKNQKTSRRRQSLAEVGEKHSIS